MIAYSTSTGLPCPTKARRALSTANDELSQYLQCVNETRQTMKIGSEQFMVSPPPPVVRTNDRFVRRLISRSLPAIEPSDEVLDRLPLRMGVADVKSWYWAESQRGRKVALRFGAADHANVDKYFDVDVTRAWLTRAQTLRQAHPAPSLTSELLQLVESIAASQSISVPQASRAAALQLSRAWSTQDPAVHTERNLREALRELCADHGPSGTSGGVLRDPTCPERLGGAAFPLSSPESEVQEFAGVFGLSRLDFDVREMELSHRIARDPRLQYALLAFHSIVVVQARTIAAKLVARFGDSHVLLPFTELCVDVDGYSSPSVDLVPNPKLITVLVNNILPGISGIMLRDEVPLDRLNGSVIQQGVASAVSRGIFEVRIGAFNRSESDSEPTLDGMTLRVCPARDPFAQLCARWLPFLFERYPGDRAA